MAVGGVFGPRWRRHGGAVFRPAHVRDLPSSSSFLLPLVAIAVLLQSSLIAATFLTAKEAPSVPAKNLADLKRLLADGSVRSIEVKADITLTEDLPQVKRSILIVGKCLRRGRCIIDGQDKFATFVFLMPAIMKNMEVRRARRRAVDARAGFVGDNLAFRYNTGGISSELPVTTGLFVEGDCVLTRSLFADNVGYGDVAMTVMPSNATVVKGVISRCTFTNNTASYMTGALSLDNVPGYQAWYRVEDSSFIGNSGRYADGAVSAHRANVEFVRCKFTNNTVTEGNAGAIRIQEYERLSICNCKFSGNVAGENSDTRNVLIVHEGVRPLKTVFCPAIPPHTGFLCSYSDPLLSKPCFDAIVGKRACSMCKK